MVIKSLKRILLFFIVIMLSYNSVYAAQNRLIQKRLYNYASYMVHKRTLGLGYPVNQNINLKGFYKWYVNSGLYLTMMNNAGDPFSPSTYPLNSLQFEKEVIEFFGPKYGFDIDNLWGIVTNSGTDGNNHGIYFGAKYLEKKTGKKPVVYVSEDAHYSNRRLANLQNLDLVIVPADEHGKMIPEELEKSLVKNRPALIIYAVGTTFKGGTDNQNAINSILEKYPSITVYRHVDAALFGGYLPYTDYRNIVNRKEHPFESIAISGHKFFGMDEPAGIFLTTKEVKENQVPYNITYLNTNMPMINCSRSSISPLKLWWIINHSGVEGFSKQANAMLENAAWLKSEMDKLNWPAWLEPMSNTVYFKRPPKTVFDKYNLAPEKDDRLGGNLSHIVVMQHITKKQLQNFLNDLAATK